MENNLQIKKPRILPLPLKAYSWLSRFIFWAQKKKYGESLLPSLLWGRSPNLLYGLQAFYRAIDRKTSPLEPSLRALINVKVSQINNCEFCVDISSSLLQKRNVSIEKIMALKDFEISPLFNNRERCALTYAEAITYPSKGVSDEIFSRLKVFFSDDEIIELTGLIGYQNLSSKFNAALAVPAQGFCFVPKKNKTNE